MTGIPTDIADGDDTVDDDNDPTNELQDLSFDPDTNTLSISQRNSVILPEVGDEVLIDSCPVGFSIRVINEDGTVVCEEDTDTKYSAAAPLTLTGTTFSLESAGCLDGQVLKWDTTLGQWKCANDIDTNTDTDTNAATLCPNGTFLNGDGTCDAGFLDADGVDDAGPSSLGLTKLLFGTCTPSIPELSPGASTFVKCPFSGARFGDRFVALNNGVSISSNIVVSSAFWAGSGASEEVGLFLHNISTQFTVPAHTGDYSVIGFR